MFPEVYAPTSIQKFGVKIADSDSEFPIAEKANCEE